MEDSDIEIPNEVSQVGNVIETDIEELLNDIFNNLSQLRSKALDEVSKRKTGYTPKLDVIISQVGNFTQMKKSLRCEASVHLQKLYPKWLRVLETALSAVRKKVDEIFEDSTLCTEDFTAGPSPFEGLKQSKAPVLLYPDISSELLDQELLTTKRKRGRASSPPSGAPGRKLRKNSRLAFKESEPEDSSEDEPTPPPTPTRSSNRYSSRKSAGFNTSVKTEAIEEYSTEEETPTSTPERNRSSPKKIVDNKINRLNQLVWDWFTKEQLKNVPISRQMVQTKAKQIAKDIGYTNFKASFEWLESFKTLYHVSWTPTGLCGSPTLESNAIQEGFVAEEEEIEEEEEVPKPISTRKQRSTRISMGNALKRQECLMEEEENEEEEEVPKPVATRKRSTARISSGNSLKRPGSAKSISSTKATRKSMAKMSAEPMDVEAIVYREIPIIKTGRKNGSEILNPALKSKQKSGKQAEIACSFWKPIMSMDSNDMLEQPAVYQIKVHQAKKPAYIGVCDNLYSQVLKCQKAQSKQKQLDQFLDRNRNDIEVMVFYCNSLADAKKRHQEEIGKFKEKFKRNPVFNI